jgi:hypothetical protein
MDRACSTHGREGICIDRQPEGKRPLVRPRHRWENTIKMDLKELGYEGVNWIHLAQDRVAVNTVMNFRVP